MEVSATDHPVIGSAKSELWAAKANFAVTFMAYRNLALRTRTEYDRDIADLLSFLQAKCKIRRLRQCDRRHLEAYLAELDRRGYAGSTRRRKVAALKSFFRFLVDEGLLTLDPAARLIPPVREWNQPRVLSDSEYKRLQLACAHEPRDAAIIEVLLQTGIRLSEVARMTPADAEVPTRITKEPTGAGSLRIHGKGRKERTVSLNWKAGKALKTYLAVRPDVGGGLFVSKFRTAMGPRAIQNVVKKYLREAGIAGASVHSLRHTFGTHMVKKGASLRVVQEALGHESLKTTSIYVSLARDQMDRELQEHAL